MLSPIEIAVEALGELFLVFFFLLVADVPELEVAGVAAIVNVRRVKEYIIYTSRRNGDAFLIENEL